MLFSTVNVIRHLDHDPEALLRAANAKFERRFRAVERRLAEQGLDFASADAARLDTLWNAVKLETG